jgi:hypothetical protein
MPLNGTNFTNAPWTTIFAAYTDLLGVAAYAIIFFFVVGAVYLKTQNLTSTAGAAIVTSMLFTGAGIYGQMPALTLLSGGIIILSIVGVVASIIYDIRR